MFEDYRKRRALKYAAEREFKAELYKIKYGENPPKKVPWGFSKWYAVYLNLLCFIIICFAMYATLILQDSQMVVVIIGGLLTSTVSFTVSLLKAKAENTEGGIQYERMKQEFLREQNEEEEDDESS